MRAHSGEKKEDTFLLCYTPFKDDEINEIVDELNKTKAESILDTPIDWDKIAYLKVHKQPIFD